MKEEQEAKGGTRFKLQMSGLESLEIRTIPTASRARLQQDSAALEQPSTLTVQPPWRVRPRDQRREEDLVEEAKPDLHSSTCRCTWRDPPCRSPRLESAQDSATLQGPGTDAAKPSSPTLGPDWDSEDSWSIWYKGLSREERAAYIRDVMRQFKNLGAALERNFGYDLSKKQKAIFEALQREVELERERARRSAELSRTRFRKVPPWRLQQREESQQREDFL